MFEISLSEAIALHRAQKQLCSYPAKNDPRLASGLNLPIVSPRFQFKRGATIFTIGSCFARNIEDKLTAFKLPTTAFSVPPEEWKGRSNGILNEYTPSAMLQRVEASLAGQGLGERAIAKSKGEYLDLLVHQGAAPVSLERLLARRDEIDRLYRQLPEAEAVIITLGLVQSWYDHQDGLYLNRFPPLVAITHEPKRYTLRVLDADAAYGHAAAMVQCLVGAGVRKILCTVSPVPMNSAFNGLDATITNSYSKAALRVCAQRLYDDFPQVDYFPSYEIAMSGGPAVFGTDNIHIYDAVVGQITDYMTSLYVPADS